MRLEHIGIQANNVDILAKWYCKILDLKIWKKLEKEGRPPVYYLKSNGGTTIEILPTKNERKQRELEDPGFSHVGIIVDNFDKTSSYLESKGIKLMGVRDTSAGWKIGYLKDPEGNTLEIVQR